MNHVPNAELRGEEAVPDRAGRNWLRFVIALTVAGAALRFAWLGRESLWTDEVLSVVQAGNTLPGLIRRLAGESVHPPLYHLLLHFWMVIGKSELAVRSLSALLGSASIPLLCRLGRRLLGFRAAMLAGLLFTIAPAHLYYSQEARMYALLVLLAIGSTDLMLSVVREERRWALPLYVVSLAAMLYTHYYGAYILLGQAVFALFAAGTATARLRLLGAQGAAVCLFLFWAPALVGQIGSGRAGWIGRAYGRPGLEMLGAAYASFAAGPELRRWEVALTPLLAIIVLAGVFRFQQQDRRRPSTWAPDMAGLLLASWLIVPVLLAFLVSQVKPSFVPRYVIGSFPAAVLLAGRGFLRLRQWRRGAASVLLAVILVVWAKVDVDFYRFRTKENWRGVVERISRQRRRGDIVVFYPPWNRIAYDYYASGRVAVPIYTLPPTVGASQRAPTDICKPFLVGRSRVWLVERPAKAWFDPSGKVLRCLDLHGRLSGRWDYSGITLRLYTVGTRESGPVNRG